MSSVYGMTMAVANERWFGTLGPLLASPANRAAVFLGRGVPVLANGLLVSAFTFGAGVLLLGFARRCNATGPRRRRPRHRHVVHRLRDAARLDRFARQGLLLRGQPGLLPDAAVLRRQHPDRRVAGLDGRGVAVPAAHARHRERRGRSPRAAAWATSRGCLDGVGVAAAYGAAAFGLFRFLERESRRTAVLDAY